MTEHSENSQDTQGYGLGPEWIPGQDGIPFRRAARVVVLDARHRALLVRGHDSEDPDYTWWFTIGGGIEAGEDPRAGACRELREETGIEAEPEQLEGPVFTREALFRFSSVTCRQAETFYLLRLDTVDDALGTGAQEGWTDLEREVLDELRWWSADGLRAEAERGTLVFPLGLADRLETWREPWDPTAEVPHAVENDE